MKAVMNLNEISTEPYFTHDRDGYAYSVDLLTILKSAIINLAWEVNKTEYDNEFCVYDDANDTLTYTTISGKGKWVIDFQNKIITFDGYRKSFLIGAPAINIGSFAYNSEKNRIDAIITLFWLVNLPVNIKEYSTSKPEIPLLSAGSDIGVENRPWTVEKINEILFNLTKK